ncbi:hypothetical protein JOV91_001132 [Neisseria gonorrhoeae]
MQHITTKLFYFKITDISFFIDFKFHIFNILGILFQRKRKQIDKNNTRHSFGQNRTEHPFSRFHDNPVQDTPLPIPPAHPAKFHTQGKC